MAQAVTALVSLLVVALTLRTILLSLARELPALRALAGAHPLARRAAQRPMRAIPARRAQVLRVRPAPRRATA